MSQGKLLRRLGFLLPLGVLAFLSTLLFTGIAGGIIRALQKKWTGLLEPVDEQFKLYRDWTGPSLLLSLLYPSYVGWVDGHRVHLSTENRPPRQHPLFLQPFGSINFARVRVDTGLTALRSAGREDILTRLGKVLGGGDTELGIEAFDDKVKLDGGPPHLLFAALGETQRSALKTIADLPNARLEEGELELRISLGKKAELIRRISLGKKAGLRLWPVRENNQLLVEFQRTVELVKQLEPISDEPAECLLHNLLNDPEPSFRVRCFEFLLGFYPDHPATAKAREAAEHPEADPNLRLLLAIRRSKVDPAELSQLLQLSGIDERLRARARKLVGSASGGRLSVEAEGEAGGLSMADRRAGSLSKVRGS